MNNQISSEQIKSKLFLSMIIIFTCFCLISIPLTIYSYLNYKEAKTALAEVLVLKEIADLANKVSRERAPANNAMASSMQEKQQNIAELKEFRQHVDSQIQKTLDILNQYHFTDLARFLDQDVRLQLNQGRKAVDEYVNKSITEKNAQEFDGAVQEMFLAWDKTRELLTGMVQYSIGKESSTAANYTFIILLADLRDQAGRVASNIIAALSFNEKIPPKNYAQSLQTQYQVQYLWHLLHTLQLEQAKNSEYKRLSTDVEEKFLQQGLEAVDNLMQQSNSNLPYSMTAQQLTATLSDKFLTVIRLQDYLITRSVEEVRKDYLLHINQLIFTVIVFLISLATTLFTFVYARQKIFIPLIEARQRIIRLVKEHESSKKIMSMSLLEAIYKLQAHLSQRDLFEVQLKNIANTDELTGVSNRFALAEYVQILENRPEKLFQTGLIILDIDNFKKINDCLGHIVGDQVIQFLAEQLKKNSRSSDLIVRYGGDEFLIVIDRIYMPDLFKIAEKIRLAVENATLLTDGKEVQISISAGIAVGAQTWLQLLEQADKALFKAKRAGRNCVEFNN